MPTIFQSPYSFCTDRKSLCEALFSSNPRTFSIHHSINSISSSIFFQWISGHSVIPGNDLANKVAKEATTITTDKILPVSFPISIQVINETIHNILPTHKHIALMYQHWRVSCDAKQINNRKDDGLLVRLQSSHHPSLRQYLDRLAPSQDLPELLPRSSRSPSLALWMSCYYDDKVTSVWELPRVLKVACHSNWGFGVVCKEDPGQTWHLTQ